MLVRFLGFQFWRLKLAGFCCVGASRTRASRRLGPGNLPSLYSSDTVKRNPFRISLEVVWRQETDPLFLFHFLISRNQWPILIMLHPLNFLNQTILLAAKPALLRRIGLLGSGLRLILPIPALCDCLPVILWLPLCLSGHYRHYCIWCRAELVAVKRAVARISSTSCVAILNSFFISLDFSQFLLQVLNLQVLAGRLWSSQ